MDMQDWDQSVGQQNQKSQKFVIFFNDDNESQTVNFKRQLDEGGVSDFCLRQDTITNASSQTSDSPQIYLQGPVYDRDDQKQQHKLKNHQLKNQEHQDRHTKKQYNSSMYSKVYRQKKKQKVKILQEENIYLKKKVDELQMRLREKQMQINRIKFIPPQEHDIKILNQQIMQKLKIISQPNAKQPQKTQDIPVPQPVISGDKRMQQFLKMFDLYGFGGIKAKQLQEYYVNEYIQNVMRDREKYYLLNWINKKHQKNLPKTAFQIDLQQSFYQTQAQKKESVELAKMIRPVTMQLLKASREIYKYHKTVIQALGRIHTMARSQLSKNIDYTQKRMKMVMWFQANRHRKEMREIRSEWIQMVKSEQEPWLEDKQKQGGKKKVVK